MTRASIIIALALLTGIGAAMAAWQINQDVNNSGGNLLDGSSAPLGDGFGGTVLSR